MRKLDELLQGFEIDGKRFIIMNSNPYMNVGKEPVLTVNFQLINTESSELVSEISIPAKDIASCSTEMLMKHRDKLINLYKESKNDLE